MAVEIKQTLEREFEVNLTAQDLRTLTFAKLQELTDGKLGDPLAIKDETPQVADFQRNLLLRSLGHEEMADKVIIPLNKVRKESDAYALFIPGIEGVISPVLYTLCKSIEIPMYALQLHKFCREESLSKVISLISKASKKKWKKKT